jgi:hypothetical protein
MYIIQLFLASALYLVGITFGLYFAGYTCKELTLEELVEENQKEQKMIELMELMNFPHKYEDELNDALNDYDKNNLPNIEFEVPMNRVLMYYDPKKETFCYYTKHGDVAYKYLNVVCRKFVIDNKCKELYKEGIEQFEEPKEIIMDKCFTKKRKKPTITETKIINKFIRMGTYEDYYESKKVVPKNTLSFMDYFSKK